MERGETFTPPRNEREAYGAIARLKTRPRTSGAEIQRERRQISDDMATCRGDAAQVQADETDGYGSSATWSRPELLATFTALDGTEHRLFGRRGEHGVRVMDHGPGSLRDRTGRRTLVADGLTRLSDLKIAVHSWLRRHAADTADAEVADYLVG